MGKDTAAGALLLAEQIMPALGTTRDLWGQAFQGLSEGDAEILQSNQAPTIQDMRDALQSATDLKDAVDQKRIKFTFRGKEVLLVEVCGQIVEGIRAFEKVIDKGVSMDRTGYAALPWGTIKLLLGVIAAGLATIADVISYYAELESIYLHGKHTPEESGEENQTISHSPRPKYSPKTLESFKVAVIAVYTEVLVFLAEARRFYQTSLCLPTSITSTDDTRSHFKVITEKARRKLTRGIQKTKGVAASIILDSPERYSAIIEKIEEGRQKVEDSVNIMKGQLDLIQYQAQAEQLEKTEEILSHFDYHQSDQSFFRWISPIESTTNHREYRESRLPDSGLWLLKHDEFQKWSQSSRSTILWLHGSLGTGKSTLMSLIVDRSLEKLEYARQKSWSSPVLFFYFKPTYSAEHCLRDILRQLIQFDPAATPRMLKSAYKDERRIGGKECIKMLEEVIRGYSSVTLVLDGIQHCMPPSGSEIQELNYIDLLQGIMELPRKITTSIFRIVFSGRPDARVDYSLRNPDPDKLSIQQISTDEQPSDDVKRYVATHIYGWDPAMFLPRETETRRQKAKDIVFDFVVRRTGRMYLWAVLILTRMRNNQTLSCLGDIEEELKSLQLPEDLNALYNQIHSVFTEPTTSPTSQRVACAMKLLFSSCKGLGSYALIDALRAGDENPSPSKAYEDEIDDLVHGSNGLIVEDQESDTLRFRHSSFVDYLRGIDGYAVQAQAVMAKACISTLKLAALPRSFQLADARHGTRRESEEIQRGRHRNSGRVEGRTTIYHFMEYATIYWAKHTALYWNGTRVDKNDLPLSLVTKFWASNSEAWIMKAQGYLSERPIGFYGEEFEAELENSISESASILFPACVYGFTEIIVGMTQNSHNPEVHSDFWDVLNQHHLSALHVACRFSQPEIVKLLSGICPNPPHFSQALGRSADERYAFEFAFKNAKSLSADYNIVEIFSLSFQRADLVLKGIVAAMKNKHCSKDIIHEILEAASSLISAKAPLLLLDPAKNGTELLPILRYQHITVELITVLCADQPLNIAENLLENIITSGHTQTWSQREDLWEFLLEHCPGMSMNVARLAIQAGDLWLTKYLLASPHSSNSQDIVPDAILRAAVKHESQAHRLTEVVLNWKPTITPSSETLEAAILNPTTNQELLDMLPKAKDGPVELNVEAVVAMASNLGCGDVMIKRCFLRGLPHSTGNIKSHGWILPEFHNETWVSVVVRAIRTGNLPFLKDILDRWNTATATRSLGLDLFEILYGAFLPSTHKTTRWTRLAYRDDIAWDKQYAEAIGIVISHPRFEQQEIQDELYIVLFKSAATTQGPMVFSLLFGIFAKRKVETSECRAWTPEFAERVLMESTKNAAHGDEIMKFVLNRTVADLPISEAVLRSCVQKASYRTVAFVLRHPRCKVVEYLFQPDIGTIAMENPDLDSVKLIFKTIGLIRNSDLILAARRSHRLFNCLMQMPGLRISRPDKVVLLDIARTCRITKPLQQLLRCTDPDIYRHREFLEQLFEEAAGNKYCTDMLVFLFNKFHSVSVTTRMFESAALNKKMAPEMIRVLLNRCNDEDLESLITGGVIFLAAQNDREAPQALQALLMEVHPKLEEIEEVLDAIRLNDKAGPETLRVLERFYPQLSFKLLLKRVKTEK
ncbi:hypothetical protein QBC38DRAFT_523040 [Podospora fimiseda]|uniref:Nephrocystin 3-like N-terminal domain-containing protein n=1 Tax=Podospora fimiseda TaxID=252190 RepID=A0AAN6YNC8_9PEZI|nr:hypothetical protein QBC38DRAFT_523040 [Podospora fimiseda]